MKAIIEHLEPEVYPWCILEYRHISQIVGKDNLVFTNVPLHEHHKLKEFGNVKQESVKQLSFKRVCVLDPVAKQTLVPVDANTFDYYLFGGILGNFPMENRTEKELSQHLKQFLTRNIGPKQMSTDTAVLVVHKIIDEQVPFEQLKFVDELEIELEEGYSQVLPYRYLLKDGLPVLPEGLIAYLKDEDLFLE